LLDQDSKGRNDGEGTGPDLESRQKDLDAGEERRKQEVTRGDKKKKAELDTAEKQVPWHQTMVVKLQEGSGRFEQN